jgi:hypothetical protein
LHECGANPAQLAFGGAGQVLAEEVGDDETEYGIAKEFEPFVVVPAGAAMPQRPLEQGGVVELVAESGFEFVQGQFFS